jgi:hypothetical protein
MKYMLNLTISFKNKGLPFLFVLLLGLGLVSGVAGCGGGSNSGPLPDQDASGLFKDGTAELDGGAVMLNDLRGFVVDGRVIIFSVAGHLLIDGTIGTISSDDFTATVDIYENGAKTQTGVSISGIVLTESSISGTLSGSGIASGGFTLIFDPLYNRGATFARVFTSIAPSIPFVGAFKSTMVGATTNNFEFPQDNLYDFSARVTGPIRCSSEGDFMIPDSEVNIYVLNEVLTKTDDPGCTMSDSPNYSGFAAAVDGVSVDDTIVYATTNGTNAQFAELIR